MPDFFLVDRRHINAFDNAQRFARVHGPFFGIEGAVGPKHDLVEIVERKTSMCCRHAAEHGCVGIERVLEVVERPLLQALQDHAQIFVRCARAELVATWADAAFQHRYDAAEMVRDDLQVRNICP